MHYRPRTAVLNNLEFDHADIFADLAAIETPVPSSRAHRAGLGPARRQCARGEPAARARHGLLERGAALRRAQGGAGRAARTRRAARLRRAARQPARSARVEWPLLGEHNQLNALAAIAAAEHVGVAPEAAARALASFENVRRRLELRGDGARGVDAGLRRLRAPPDGDAHDDQRPAPPHRAPASRILAVFEPRSNTMKLGAMKAQLPWALEEADLSFCHSGGLGWDAAAGARAAGRAGRASATTIDALVRAVAARRQAGRPRAVHEQRRLRRRAREAARRARALRRRGEAGRPPRICSTCTASARRRNRQGARRSRPGVGAHAPRLHWWCPQLPASPREAMALVLRARSHALAAPRRMAVIGSSLGGFYATVVAERLGCRAVLLNPAVDPARDLARHIGETSRLARPERALLLSRRVHRRAARAAPAGARRGPSATSRSSPRATRCSTGARWRRAMPARACELLEGGDHALSRLRRAPARRDAFPRTGSPPERTPAGDNGAHVRTVRRCRQVPRRPRDVRGRQLDAGRARLGQARQGQGRERAAAGSSKPAAGRAARAARALAEEIDLDLAWEFAPDAEFGFADLARDYFERHAPAPRSRPPRCCGCSRRRTTSAASARASSARRRRRSVKAALLGIERKKQIAAQIDAWAGELVGGALPGADARAALQDPVQARQERARVQGGGRGRAGARSAHRSIC